MFYKLINSIQNFSFSLNYKEAKAKNINYIKTLDAFKLLLENNGFGKWIKKDIQTIQF